VFETAFGVENLIKGELEKTDLLGGVGINGKIILK
jgi:hypothetical protein